MSPDHRVSSHYSLPWSQGVLSLECPLITGCPLIIVSLITGCPLIIVSLITWCPLIRVSPDHRVSSHRSVPWSQGVLSSECPLIKGCPLIGVSSHQSVPWSQRVLSSECPLITGCPLIGVSLITGCPLIGVSPDHRVSSHRSVPWSQVVLSLECPLITGCPLIRVSPDHKVYCTHSNDLVPWGKPITLKIRSSWSWWYGVLVLMSSWRQWNIGSDVNSSAKIHPMAQISEIMQVIMLYAGINGRK